MTNTMMPPLAAWTSYWTKISRLFWSSAEVIARRSVLSMQSGDRMRWHPDFDGMVSEKGKAMYESWLAMVAEAMKLAPLWGLRFYSNAMAPKSTPAAVVKSVQNMGNDTTRAALQLIHAGMTTTQRRVSANAKRLRKHKR